MVGQVEDETCLKFTQFSKYTIPKLKSREHSFQYLLLQEIIKLSIARSAVAN